MKDRLIYLVADAAESDNVGAFLKAGSDGDPISSTNVGGKEALDVNIVGGADSGIFAEDSVHASGANGQFVLAVQTAAQGALANDGDYAPLQVDSSGRLRTITDIDLSGDLVSDDDIDVEDPLKVGYRAVSGALTPVSAGGDKANAISDLWRRLYVNDTPNISLANAATTVDDTAGGVALPASALSGRRKIYIQNKETGKELYIGATGVTTSNGFEIRRGATWEFPIGPNIPIFAIVATGTADVRTLELA